MRSLEFRALALVYLVLGRPRYTEFDAHYFPELDVAFSRVSEPKNYRDGDGVDPSDRTVLCAEVPCSVGDDTWRAADDALGAMVADGLVAQGLPRRIPPWSWSAGCRTPTRCTAPGSSSTSPRPTTGSDASTTSSRSGGRACSHTTTPTTRWRWGGRRPTRYAAGDSTGVAGSSTASGSRAHVVED